MSSGAIIFLELTAVLGVAFFFGIREILSHRRWKREQEAKRLSGENEPPSA